MKGRPEVIFDELARFARAPGGITIPVFPGGLAAELAVAAAETERQVFDSWLRNGYTAEDAARWRKQWGKELRQMRMRRKRKRGWA